MSTDADRTVGHDNRGATATGKHDQFVLRERPAAGATDASSGDPQQQQSQAQAQQPWPSAHASYDLLGRIGRGAFASVWRARCKSTGRDCAVKILDLEGVDSNFIDIRHEVQSMRLSSHPNVLTCYTSFIQDTNLWLVMQLMSKGSSLHCVQSARATLRRRQQRAGGPEPDVSFEDHVTFILYETLLGLKYIHNNGQIHRDIKASNILLSADGEVRIADFGVSGYLVQGGSRRENTRTFVGTPCWMAPEVMEQVHGYDYTADIWSVGITALELAKGYAPYARFAPMKVLLLTIQEDPPSLGTYDDHDDDDEDFGGGGSIFSKSFQAMVRCCLQKDPKKRPNCDELLANRHFRLLSSAVAAQDAARAKLKVDLCDIVEDVGVSSTGAIGGAGSRKLPSCDPVYVVTSNEESRPSGTTWVFSDGSSQVLQSSQAGGDHQDDKGEDFFDAFERQTQGENYSREAAEIQAEAEAARPNPPQQQQQDQKDTKEDLEDFFNDFESTTGGEHFQRKS